MSKAMIKYVRGLGTAILVLAAGFLPSTAFADGRKVTRFEYDGLGRQVKVSVYDDTGTTQKLVSEGTKVYDKYHNVVTETQTRVLGDDRVSTGTNTAVTNYSTIIQNYAFEDTTWPTKVTKVYDPRMPTDDVWAKRFYYDGVTGQLELSHDNSYYCTNPAFGAGKTAPDAIAVEQSGQSLSVQLRPYLYCRAGHISYDNLGRPVLSKSSYKLGYSQYGTANYDAFIWQETAFEYYGEGDPQKGALKRSIQGGAGEAVRLYTDYNWDGVGNLISVTINGESGTLGYVSTAEYDALRRVKVTKDPEGGESQYVFDAAGRLTDISVKIDTGSWAITHAEYYDSGRLKSIKDPDDNLQHFTYDAAGRSDVKEDGVGRKTKTIYYPNGQVKCAIRGYGTDLVQAYAMFDYAADGQVKAQRPAKGVTLIGGNTPTDCTATNDTYDTSFSYDGYRRLFETMYPERSEDIGQAYATDTGFVRGAGHSYTRQWLNQRSEVTLQRNRRGEMVENWYTHAGDKYQHETDEHLYSDYFRDNGQHYYSVIYPKVGGVYDPTQLRYVLYYQDALGRTTSEMVREGSGANLGVHAPRTDLSYDIAGNLEKLTYFGGAYTKYAYNKNGSMVGASFSQSASASTEREIAGFGYDLRGTRTFAMGGKGLADKDTGVSYAINHYSFDADGDLKKIQHRWLTASTDTVHTGVDAKYDQDDSGKMIKQFMDNPAWRYNPSADVTQNYAGTNVLDQYGSVDLGDGGGALVQSYDGAGNLTADGAGRTYTYNSENQLMTATGAGLNMEYRYDGLGRRSHSLDHIAGTETFHKHFGQMEIGDYAMAREGGLIGVGKPMNYTPIFRVVIGQGIDERIAYYDVNGDDLEFYNTNHQGSTLAMTAEDGTRRADADGGKYLYGPYGNDVSGASASGQPYRYTGRRLDPQTGLYYYRARYYDPKVGRFLQTDPIGTDDQMNLYGYVGNDPLNFTDPSGRSAKGKILKPWAKGLRKKADQRKLKNAKARGRRAQLAEEKRRLTDGTSTLSAERQKELLETGKLKNMDLNHLPTVSSGKNLDDKINLAESPGPNSSFMEPKDHQNFHKSKGGTRVKLDENGDIISSVLIGTAIGLEIIASIPDITTIFESTEVACGTPACFDDNGNYIGLPDD